MATISPSPSRIEEHRANLRAFLEAYRAYLEAGPDGPRELRQRVIARIPAADRAMEAAGVVPMATDPPALGPARQTYVGLTNLAFKHEQPGWGRGSFTGTPGSDAMIVDTVEQAIAELDEMEREERRRRRSPLYWVDRGIRYLLAIPAYIVSRIVGVPVTTIDRSQWGLLLRVVGVIADGLAIYFGGRAFGLW